MIKKMLIAAVVLAALGVAGLYFPMDFLRPSVQRALERGLGRKVEAQGSVYFNLFGAPGLKIESVVIHEDPRAGIEPFLGRTGSGHRGEIGSPPRGRGHPGAPRPGTVALQLRHGRRR